MGTCHDLVSVSQLGAPSLHMYWLEELARIYLSEARLVCLSVTHRRTRILLPLKWLTDRTVGFMCDATCDYADVYCSHVDSDDERLRTMIYAMDRLRQLGGRTILLSHVPSDSATLAHMVAFAKELPAVCEVLERRPIRVIRCVSTAVTDGWIGVDQHLVAELRRKQHQLREHHDVRVRVVRSSRPDLQARLREAMRMNIERWRSVGLRSKFEDERRRRFTIAVCERAAARGELFLSLLQVNGETWAYRLGFVNARTVYEWSTSYSVVHRRWSPGSLLLLSLLEQSSGLGFDGYDLMQGEEAYKARWAQVERYTVSIRLQL